jgi:hypothetical protein
MTGRMSARATKLVAALLAVTAVTAIGASAAGAEVIFNNIPKPFPGNLASQAFEATQTSEFGSQVEFAGTDRTSPTVTATLSSWACGNLQGGASCHTEPKQTFEYPITLNVYEVGPENQPGKLLDSSTQVFHIPYRPSASKRCSTTPEGVVGWGKNCFSGKAFKIRFPLVGAGLPEKAIVSIAYNTTDYGAEPTHSADVGEDSLNVALFEPGEPVMPVGTSPLPEDNYINSQNSAEYCGSSTPTGTFGLSGPCWGGYQSAIRVIAKKH